MFVCGEQDAVLKISEPKTCHYEIEFMTVSACYATDTQLDALRSATFLLSVVHVAHVAVLCCAMAKRAAFCFGVVQIDYFLSLNPICACSVYVR